MTENETSQSISRFFGGSIKLELASTASAVSEAVQLILALLGKFESGPELKRLELALDEAIRNAYEHGNLSITSEQKAELAAKDKLEKELRIREKLAHDAGKRIRVSVSAGDGRFVCVVSDDGDGFEWRSKLAQVKKGELDPTALSGRGVSLIHQLFDVVSYNEKGNELRIEKALSLPPT